MNKMPNIFEFATSELSQDAFFCWLLSWSKEEYKTTNPALYERSRKFLDFIISPEIDSENFIVHKIGIKRQYKKTDFFVILNNNIVLLFEDKVNTKNHDNQLETSSKVINSEFKDVKNVQIIKIYLKTDFIWKEEELEVEKAGFKPIDIIQINDLLLENSNNNIYDDFCQNIKSKVQTYQSYKNSHFNKNNFNQLKGFLFDLSQTDLNFVGFDKYHTGTMSWYIISWKQDLIYKNCHLSLEIFKGELMIKAHVYTAKINKGVYRNKFNGLPHKFSQYKTEINKRTGKDMMVIKINEFPVLNEESHFIDFGKTVGKLKEISLVFENAVKEY